MGKLDKHQGPYKWYIRRAPDLPGPSAFLLGRTGRYYTDQGAPLRIAEPLEAQHFGQQWLSANRLFTVPRYPKVDPKVLGT